LSDNNSGILINLLKNSNEKLDLVSKLLLLNISSEIKKSLIEKISSNVNTPGKTDIWKLCDGNHTISQIATELNRAASNISRDIGPWLKDKIVIEITKGNEKYSLSYDSLMDYILSTMNWDFLKD